jgi:hypothetical protein
VARWDCNSQTGSMAYDKARLQRLAKAMSLESQLKTYLERKRKYDEDLEVEASDSVDAGL